MTHHDYDHMGALANLHKGKQNINCWGYISGRR
nr:hypothetical protein [Clostridium sp. Marseille-Q2269]